jgi:hypothetical protein
MKSQKLDIFHRHKLAEDKERFFSRRNPHAVGRFAEMS